MGDDRNSVSPTFQGDQRQGFVVRELDQRCRPADHAVFLSFFQKSKVPSPILPGNGNVALAHEDESKSPRAQLVVPSGILDQRRQILLAGIAAAVNKIGPVAPGYRAAASL